MVLSAVQLTLRCARSPGSFVYWRGNAWAPLAMLVYWGLDNPQYANVSGVATARKGLANSYHSIQLATSQCTSLTIG